MKLRMFYTTHPEFLQAVMLRGNIKIVKGAWFLQRKVPCPAWMLSLMIHENGSLWNTLLGVCMKNMCVILTGSFLYNLNLFEMYEQIQQHIVRPQCRNVLKMFKQIIEGFRRRKRVSIGFIVSPSLLLKPISHLSAVYSAYVWKNKIVFVGEEVLSVTVQLAEAKTAQFLFRIF